MPEAFVYLLRCRDGSLYCGWSTDPAARETAHNRGRGAAYTRSRRPVTLVYIERLDDRSAALKREWAIKQLPRAAKLRLTRGAAAAVRALRAARVLAAPARRRSAAAAAR